MLDLKSWELARYNVDDKPTQAMLDALAERVRAAADAAAKAVMDADEDAAEIDTEAKAAARQLAERRAFAARSSAAALLEEFSAAKASAKAQITYEVKRLNRKDAQAHQRILSSAVRAEVERLRTANIDPRETVEGETPTTTVMRGMHAQAEMGLAGLDFYDAVGADYIRQCFEKFTRRWTGVTLDGVPVTEGAHIADIADNDLVRAVLVELRRASQLSVTEGNASASPSGSAQAAGIATADSTSTAASTESAAGTSA